MSKITLAIIIDLIFIIGVLIVLFFVIRHFIRYNAQLKKKKTQSQEEIDKMNIDDL